MFHHHALAHVFHGAVSDNVLCGGKTGASPPRPPFSFFRVDCSMFSGRPMLLLARIRSSVALSLLTALLRGSVRVLTIFTIRICSQRTEHDCLHHLCFRPFGHLQRHVLQCAEFLPRHHSVSQCVCVPSFLSCLVCFACMFVFAPVCVFVLICVLACMFVCVLACVGVFARLCVSFVCLFARVCLSVVACWLVCCSVCVV